MGGKPKRCMSRGIGGASTAVAVRNRRAYALSAELNTIASARTLAERIACTSHIACVALRCTRMSRGRRAGFHSVSRTHSASS